MASKTINIGKRLQAAFGFASLNMSAELKRGGFPDAIKDAKVFVNDARSSFEELTLTQETGNTTPVVLKFGYMDFLTPDSGLLGPPPLVTFSKGKRIDRTILDGGNEVVENFGPTSWEISLQGLLIDMDNHAYPGDKVRQLIRAFDFDGTWKVESRIFLDHGIKSVYFENIDSSGIEGFEDTWAFTLRGYSIKPVGFFINQRN